MLLLPFWFKFPLLIPFEINKTGKSNTYSPFSPSPFPSSSSFSSSGAISSKKGGRVERGRAWGFVSFPTTKQTQVCEVVLCVDGGVSFIYTTHVVRENKYEQKRHFHFWRNKRKKNKTKTRTRTRTKNNNKKKRTKKKKKKKIQNCVIHFARKTLVIRREAFVMFFDPGTGWFCG